MKLSLTLLNAAAALLLLAVPTINAAQPTGEFKVSAQLQELVRESYIVKLRDNVKAKEYLSQKNSLVGGSAVTHTFDLGKFQAFATKLSASALAELKKDASVDYVEAQTIFRASGQQNNPPSWGLSRVSQHQLKAGAPYVYPDSAGSGVEAWIVDTGVSADNSEFEGRATQKATFVTGEDNSDLNGHGTHVAGTIGSRSYGVAKKVTIYGVKVLDGDGSGTTAGVISGIQYVAQNATPNKAVANMSLGGSKSKALDDAVNAAVDAGVAFIVAAGNERANACNGSPSGASKVFAVAASDSTDRQASFSNFGTCTKLYAPGVDITSTWIGGNGATNTISGTSMASPHVAGVAALYLGTGQYSSVNALYSALVSKATSGVIKGASAGTPNKLVYNQ